MSLQNEKDRPEQCFSSALGAAAAKLRSAAASSFDNSRTSRVLAWLRKNAPRLRIRVIGTFLLTFGIYGALVSAIKMIFFAQSPFEELYLSLCAIILSLPLLLSGGNISTALLRSETGTLICNYAAVRPDTIAHTRLKGRANYAFLLGVLCGSLTFVVPMQRVAWGILVLICAALIFTSPETSLVITALLLPLGMSDFYALLILLGAVSFAIKLLRGKRSIAPAPHDKAAGVLWLTVLLGCFVSYGEGNGGFVYPVIMLSYFIVAFSMGGMKRSMRALPAAVASGGVVSAFLTGLCILTQLAEGGRLGFVRDISHVSAFSAESCPVIFAALIPPAVSLIITPDSDMPGHTAALSFISMTGFLCLTGSFAEGAAALAGIVILLMYRNRRAAYGIIAVSAAGVTAWVWSGGDAAKIGGYSAGLAEKAAGVFLPGRYDSFIFGSGISGAGAAEDGGFYSWFISSFGIIGLFIFVSFLFLLAKSIHGLSRLPGIERAEGFARSRAAMCGAAAMLFCGFADNIWKNGALFALFWLLLAVASSSAGAAGAETRRLNGAERAGESASRAQITLGSD